MSNAPTLPEIFQTVESSDLNFEANLCAGLRSFYETIVDSEAYSILLDSLESPEVTARIVARVQTLANAEIDDAFEHPSDVAMATYVTALASRNLASVAASSAQAAQNTLWLRKLLRSLPIREQAYANDPEVSGEYSTDLDATRRVTEITPSPLIQSQAFAGLELSSISQPFLPTPKGWSVAGG